MIIKSSNLFLLLLLIPTCRSLPNFLDCAGNEPPWWKLWSYRKCCHSNQLPNDCECFDISSESSFQNTHLFKPECPKDINIVFTLFNNNLDSGSEISAQRMSKFDASLKTYIITHGWKASVEISYVVGIKHELLKLGPSNVVLVDWSGGAVFNYFQALANTRTVGATVARLVLSMLSEGASLDDIHMMGQSLGAHAMGLAGQEIQRLTGGGKVGRISGFDPAGPLCNDEPDIVILDRSDADFVDIIHTDTTWMGIGRSTGHVDFWPNGGNNQPGCHSSLFFRRSEDQSKLESNEKRNRLWRRRKRRERIHSFVSKKVNGRPKNKLRFWFTHRRDIDETSHTYPPYVSTNTNNTFGHVHLMPDSGKLLTTRAGLTTTYDMFGCSHKRAPDYFMFSISKCSFIGVQKESSKSCSMGFNANIGCEGDFSLTTLANPPYC